MDINDKTFAEIFDQLYNNVSILVGTGNLTATSQETKKAEAALNQYIDFQVDRQVDRVINQLEAFDRVLYAEDNEKEKQSYYGIGDSAVISFDNILSSDAILTEETKGSDGFYLNGSNLSDDHFVYYDINTYFPEESQIAKTLTPNNDPWHKSGFDFDGYLVGWNFKDYPTFPSEANGALWIPDNHNGKPVIGIEPTSFYFAENYHKEYPSYHASEHGFYELRGIEYLYIPDSIIGIGRNAFKGCRSIEYICFGTGLKWLGLDCFAICQELKHIVFESMVPPITAAEVMDLGYYDKKCIDTFEVYVEAIKNNTGNEPVSSRGSYHPIGYEPFWGCGVGYGRETTMNKNDCVVYTPAEAIEEYTDVWFKLFNDIPYYDSYDYLEDCLLIHHNVEWFAFGIAIKEVIMVTMMFVMVESIYNIARSLNYKKIIPSETIEKNGKTKLQNRENELRKAGEENVKYWENKQQNYHDKYYKKEWEKKATCASEVWTSNYLWMEEQIEKAKVTLEATDYFMMAAEELVEIDKLFLISENAVLARNLGYLITASAFMTATVLTWDIAYNSYENLNHFDHSDEITNDGISALYYGLYFLVGWNIFLEEDLITQISVEEVCGEPNEKIEGDFSKEHVDMLNVAYCDNYIQPITVDYFDATYNELDVVTSLTQMEIINQNLSSFLDKNDQYILTENNLYIPYIENFSSEIIGEGSFDYISPNTKQVTFGEGYESIPARAFAENTNICTVELPSTLKTIGDQAFYGCSSLRNVSFYGTTLPIVSDNAQIFTGCPGPENGVVQMLMISVPEGSQDAYRQLAVPFDVNPYQISSCSIEYKIANDYATVVKIKPGEARVCIVPDTYNGYPVRKIGLGEATKYSSQYTMQRDMVMLNDTPVSLYLPDSVEYISSLAFCGSKFNFLRLPSTLKNIGNRAFEQSNLKYLNVPNNVYSMGEYTFEGCQSLETVILPDSIDTIGQYCFWNCEHLKTVIFNEKLDAIGVGAFKNCKSLERLNFGNTNLTNFCAYVFDGCSSLETIIFPATLDTLWANAFTGAYNLKYVVLGYGYWKEDYFYNSTSNEIFCHPDAFKNSTNNMTFIYPEVFMSKELENTFKVAGYKGKFSTYGQVKNKFNQIITKKEVSTFYSDVLRNIQININLVY